MRILEDAAGVKWARSCTGPVANCDALHLTCYGCDQPLSFVKAHQSTRNGIKHHVNSFYRHWTGSRAHCSSETLAHKAAKHALQVHKQKWKFSFSCGLCRSLNRIDMSNHDGGNRVDQEVSWKQYRLDIGIKQKDNLIGAIEVLVTHASTCAKLCDLTNNNIAWCEVHAHRVLDAVENDTFEIGVAKCAVQICDRCIEREKKRVVQELDGELMRSVADATMLQQKRQCIIQEATSQWRGMTPTEFHDDEQKKWILLTQFVQNAVMAKAIELGLCTEEALAHTDSMLDGKLVLKFGKHKGQTLSFVEEVDWPYLLWLAGYDFGRMDDQGRAARRRPSGKGTIYITNDIETEAKEIVQGLCFNCQDEINDFEKRPWCTWCKMCYAQLRRAI